VAFPRVSIGSLPAALIFLTHRDRDYSPRRAWGEFDTLGGRAIDDLFFADDAGLKIIYAFTSEPPHAEDVVAVAVPTQLALERVFFHTSEPAEIVLNRRGDWVGAAIPQQGIECAVPDDFDACVRIPRDELPEVIGALTVSSRAEKEPIEYARRALTRGAFFECFYLARKLRLVQPKNSAAWFYELFSYSFFGEAEDALSLYEEYPERDSSEPMAQLLAARYRVLLRQFNEARTILHALSFNESLGGLAMCEMARTFLLERAFSQAIDSATAAIRKDGALIEAYLLRGIALRGLHYDSGDSDGLREAYTDFERVVKEGGYAAAEALYHAGTVCARLGALAEAELAFRQSLLQRDRLSPRDALIRVMCALERGSEADQELTIFERLAPNYRVNLRQELAQALNVSKAPSALPTSGGSSELWGANLSESVAAARELLKVWGVPVEGNLRDCTVLDDFINRFAPDGDFPLEGEFSALTKAGYDVVGRVFALHIAQLLIDAGVVSWSSAAQESCAVKPLKGERSGGAEGVDIPIEIFVRERILLGASGDNFSSLESLVVELELDDRDRCSSSTCAAWWSVASESRRALFKAEAEWAADTLSQLGMGPSRTLSDLEALDNWIDQAFEPGGMISAEFKGRAPEDMNRFVVGLGLFVAETIASYAAVQWFDHDKAEGISILNRDLGRLFPVARSQRRVYLASAADFSSKLGSLAWSVAVSSVTEELRQGRIVGGEGIKRALIERLPSIVTFPEAELQGVVDSLLIGASLQAAR
jgi:hypothetical protein